MNIALYIYFVFIPTIEFEYVVTWLSLVLTIDARWPDTNKPQRSNSYSRRTIFQRTLQWDFYKGMDIVSLPVVYGCLSVLEGVVDDLEEAQLGTLRFQDIYNRIFKDHNIRASRTRVNKQKFKKIKTATRCEAISSSV